MSETKRIDYLDIAKGFGILAVVWAHIMLVGWTHKVIYAFHMPLFFLISGMLFKREKYSGFIPFVRKRAKRLLLPYLIYSVVTWGIWALFRLLRHDPVESFWEPLLQTFIAQGSGAFMVHNSALWFIPCLFMVELLYWVISRLNDWQNLIICFVSAGLSFLLGYLLGDKYWFLLPYNFDAALIALPFYSAGNILMKHCSHQEIVGYISNHKLLAWVFFVFCTILLLLGALSFGECSMGSSSYQCNGGIFMIRAFIGCFTTLLFSLLISLPRLLSALRKPIVWLGRYSMDVMCLHIPVKGVIMIIIALMLSTSVDYVASHFGVAFVAFIGTMCGVSIMIMLINRFIRK